MHLSPRTKEKVMNQERKQAIAEEICECESLAELKALVCDLEQSDENRIYVDWQIVPLIKCEVRKLRGVEAPTEFQPQPRLKYTRAPRGNRQYRLLKTDVSWSTKAQVHAVMEILKAHVQVGEVVDEADIVQAMIANEHVLETRQGGKRIWDYYKGDHVEGLTAHGNLEKI